MRPPLGSPTSSGACLHQSASQSSAVAPPPAAQPPPSAAGPGGHRHHLKGSPEGDPSPEPLAGTNEELN